jgi:flagella basal body P-ring formation protein FlgA
MLALLLAVLQPLSCHPIKSDWIYGRDLVAAVPALTGISPDFKVGLAPIPGQQRIFRIAELERLASANDLPAQVSEDVCFSWKLAVPDRSQMLSAMQKELANQNPSIEIVESSLMPAPEGEYVFPLSGLIVGSDKAAVWRGYVSYAGDKRFPVWARAIVKVKESHVIAIADLHEGASIRLDQLKTEVYEGPVRRERYCTDAARIEGLLLRRPVTAGTPLMDEMLETPREVNRGDIVNAIVQTGAARLEVQGVAEADGRKGQIISIRNPRSGRSFHAVVEEKGTVLVVPGGQFGLAVDTKKS